jgi:hypothetical protein
LDDWCVIDRIGGRCVGGKHLPFSHINRVVPDLAARFIPCPLDVRLVGQAGTCAIDPAERRDRGSRLGFDRRLKENHPDVLFTAPNYTAETLAFAHPDNQGEAIRNPEMRPDLNSSPRQGQVGNSARYRGDTKADRSDP